MSLVDIRGLYKFKKIFVLVSGGIDSTYLYEIIKAKFGDKTFPVNCYNPFETSSTLSLIKKDPNFILIKPNKRYNYGQILKDAFLKLPQVTKIVEKDKYRKKKQYSKKMFSCCYYIKHKAFMNDPLFKENNTVVVSGIKWGDGRQRRIWLSQLKNQDTFFHQHHGGQLYFYPFRDYRKRELPTTVIKNLKIKYPELTHSGCSICPILVLFNVTEEKERYKNSFNYAKKLGVLSHVPL